MFMKTAKISLISIGAFLLVGCVSIPEMESVNSSILLEKESIIVNQNVEFDKLNAKKELKQEVPKIKEIISFELDEETYLEIQIIMNNSSVITSNELQNIIEAGIKNVNNNISGFKITALDTNGAPVDVIDSIIKLYDEESYEISGSQVILDKKFSPFMIKNDL